MALIVLAYNLLCIRIHSVGDKIFIQIRCRKWYLALYFAPAMIFIGIGLIDQSISVANWMSLRLSEKIFLATCFIGHASLGAIAFRPRSMEIMNNKSICYRHMPGFSRIISIADIQDVRLKASRTLIFKNASVVLSINNQRPLCIVQMGWPIFDDGHGSLEMLRTLTTFLGQEFNLPTIEMQNDVIVERIIPRSM